MIKVGALNKGLNVQLFMDWWLQGATTKIEDQHKHAVNR